jgi:pre-mRNA-splicing factor RBM22/SLT11
MAAFSGNFSSAQAKHGANTAFNKEGWERSDFPILCETCLGENPYIRMTKAEFDKECKICTRPFTVFRWKPGPKARYKKTEVCQTCAKMKNVCQTCIFDLAYGLPVQVRDTIQPHAENMIQAVSDVNRDWIAEQAEKDMASGLSKFVPGKMVVNDTLLKLARTTPYYKRNRAHVCSFWVKGECKRGDECPYRHEMPETGELAVQNIKDRYYGTNDPVANKMLRRAEEMPILNPPDDQEITTLYIGGVTDEISEQDLRVQFYAYGEVKSIKMVHRSNCAFVQYTTRAAAELAAEKLHNRLIVKGARLKMMWGKPQTIGSTPEVQGPEGPPGGFPMMPTPGAPGSGPNLPPGVAPSPGMAVPPGLGIPMPTPYYPSMDPSYRGARMGPT